MALKPLLAFGLAWPQIAANRGRASYLIVTLAVTVVAWLGLSALASPFVHADIPSSGEIVVVNAQQGSPLPTRYATRIGKLPGVAGHVYQNYNPVICKAPSTAATLNGFGGPDTERRLMESGIAAASIKAWNEDPLGILVGSALAEQCGWKAGMNVEPPGMTGQPVQLHIIGIVTSEKPAANQIAYAHYEYLNRLPGPFIPHDHVNAITAYSADPRENGRVAAGIEAAFTHDDPPVEARTDSTAESGLARFGRVQNLLAWVMAALFACTAMVLVSVLAHMIAERRPQLAVMQVLGFRRGILFAVIVIECVLIVLAGTAVGVGAGLLAIHFLAPLMPAILGGFAPPAWAFTYLPLWLVVLLVASLVLPAMIVARTRPIDYPET